MEFQLKTLSPEAVARALARAERYRLLNEPGEAESICLDALEVQPDNQTALTTLLLALTEQFDSDTSCVADAWETVARLSDDYERAYYSGIVQERRAKAQLRHGTPGCGPQAYQWLRDAMSWYEKAEAIRPAANDDALLRWNACARLIMRDRHLVPSIEERGEPILLEQMPPPPEACADVRKRVRQLVAFFAAREESTLADCHSLRNDYGLGEIHLRALAKPLTHISADHGGGPVTQVEAQRCDTLGDCVVLVTGKLA